MISLVAELQQTAGEQWQSCSSPCLLWSNWDFLEEEQLYHIPSFQEASVNIKQESITISLGLGWLHHPSCSQLYALCSYYLVSLFQVTAVNKHKSGSQSSLGIKFRDRELSANQLLWQHSCHLNELQATVSICVGPMSKRGGTNWGKWLKFNTGFCKFFKSHVPIFSLDYFVWLTAFPCKL